MTRIPYILDSLASSCIRRNFCRIIGISIVRVSGIGVSFKIWVLYLHELRTYFLAVQGGHSVLRSLLGGLSLANCAVSRWCYLAPALSLSSYTSHFLKRPPRSTRSPRTGIYQKNRSCRLLENWRAVRFNNLQVNFLRGVNIPCDVDERGWSGTRTSAVYFRLTTQLHFLPTVNLNLQPHPFLWPSLSLKH